jgi:putative ABC transport system substrate-binding protein
MKRREVIFLIGCISAALPQRLIAQSEQRSKKLPTVGILSAQSSPLTQPLLDAFNRGLREQGYVEGENIVFERRVWNNDPAQLAKFSSEFVALGVVVIFAPTTTEAVAAHAVTSTIPIVTTTADLLSVGLAASLARPGGNVTGLVADVSNTKSLELLVDVLPGVSRFAVLFDPGNRFHTQRMAYLSDAAEERHLKLVSVVKRTSDDIPAAFKTMALEGLQGVMVLADTVEYTNRQKIIELATQNRIAAVFSWREEAVGGGLLAYGPDLVDLYRRSAGYVAKLLRGEKAAELPIERPERYHLIVNLKTANALDLRIPTALLATADEVIE